MLDSVTDSASFAANRDYIISTIDTDEALTAARADAEEFGINAPDEITGQLLTTLAASGRPVGTSGAVLVTPASAVTGIYVLRGLADRQNITCIDPESEFHNSARRVFKDAGYAGSRSRFLPASPLEVMGRLSYGAYHLVYIDVAPLDMKACIDAAAPLLSVGGTMVIADSLLDGTIADATRRDRDTVAAREADDYVHQMEGFSVTRLPIGSGLTLITRL